MLFAQRALLNASRTATSIARGRPDVLCIPLPTAQLQHAHQSTNPHGAACLSTSSSQPSNGSSFSRNLRTGAATITTLSLGAVAYTALYPPSPKQQQQRQHLDDDPPSTSQDHSGVPAFFQEKEDPPAESAEADEWSQAQVSPSDAAPGAQTQDVPVSHGEAGGVQGPWHTDEEMQLHLHRRALADHRLRGYIRLKEHELQNWLAQMDRAGVKIMPDAFEHHMLELEKEVNMQTSLILYQVPSPTARRDYLAKYGCSKWSEEALDVVRKYSPLIEIGAGLGFWERELSARGAKVLAVDNHAALPLPDVRITKPTFMGKVVHGDENLISKNPKHTLLLVYPGPNDMASKALQLYKGNTLLYVGEARGGVNANPAFFDALEKDWECVGVHPVEPFPNGLEKLWVLQRKKGQKGWLW